MNPNENLQENDLHAMGDQVGRLVASELQAQMRRQERQAYIAAALPGVMSQASRSLKTVTASEAASKAIDIAEAILAELDQRDAQRDAQPQPAKPAPAYYNELSGPPPAPSHTA